MTLPVVLLLAVSCQAELRPIGPALALDVPAGVVIERDESDEDYLLYSFWKDGQWLLSVYVGNTPQYPKVLREGPEKDASTPGLKGLQRRGSGSREMLLTLAGEGWPLSAHAFYFDLPRKQAKLADRILATIHRPVRGEPVAAR